MKKPRYITASDIGRASFCPHFLYLKKSNASVSEYAKGKMKHGEKAHNKLNRRVGETHDNAFTKDKRCFVASYLWGIDDVRTESLRLYRDQQLNQTLLGRVFISLYYRYSPWLVELCQRSYLCHVTTSRAVTRVQGHIRRQQERQGLLLECMPSNDKDAGRNND